MSEPVDLRGDFQLMLEVDIAYIDWLARNGVAELYYPQIILNSNETRTNTTETADATAAAEGQSAPLVP